MMSVRGGAVKQCALRLRGSPPSSLHAARLRGAMELRFQHGNAGKPNRTISVIPLDRAPAHVVQERQQKVRSCRPGSPASSPVRPPATSRGVRTNTALPGRLRSRELLRAGCGPAKAPPGGADKANRALKTHGAARASAHRTHPLPCVACSLPTCPKAGSRFTRERSRDTMECSWLRAIAVRERNLGRTPNRNAIRAAARIGTTTAASNLRLFCHEIHAATSKKEHRRCSTKS